MGFNSLMNSSTKHFPRTSPAGTLATVLLLGWALRARTLTASLGTRSRICTSTTRDKWEIGGMHEGRGETSRFGHCRSPERKLTSQPPSRASDPSRSQLPIDPRTLVVKHQHVPHR
ncbi:hypothetical protein FIBSPDRAFT_850951 [Athelia psychrophila]|uniref:Uncharacterized protein n=1 Tax=Athelia psychrophila TaxID=1759441 RepID=A0A166T5K2_9AGAM|nr:hypothetical protein FIBSPDRAFT_850951 [Fibularhizoctonia sp. CBS 109695]